MRELTPEEELFIAETLEARESAPVAVKKKTLHRRRKSRFLSFFRARNFTLLFMTIGISLAGMFMLQMFQLETTLGKERMDWIVKKGVDPALLQLAEQLGMQSLLELITLYQNRWVITAGILTVAVVLSALAYFIETLVKYFKDKKQS